MNVKICKFSELNIPEKFDELFAAMPDYRKEKIMRYLNPEDRYRSLGVGVLLNEECRMKNEECRMQNEECRMQNAEMIEYTANGKPYLKNMPDVHFSLSHSGDYVMCVVSDKPCGCDIEKIDSIDEKIYKRVLSEAELEALEKSGDIALFYEFWTRKEAVIKALDLGSSVELKKIDTLARNLDKNLVTKRTGDGYVYSIMEKTLANYMLL